MSTQNRSGGGGGGGQKAKKGANPASSGGNDGNTNKKTEHAKTEKEKPHAKPTAEQIRIAQITDIKGGLEDSKMQEKVASIMETTQRSEEDVCYALYECDNDLDRAVIFLLETLTEDAFEKTSKKKSKNRTLSTNNNNDGGDGDWLESNSTSNARSGNQATGPDKERSRSRGGMRGGRQGSDSRGWRGREARENERNAADTKGGDGWRPGRGPGRSGSGRGGYGGGSRGGRVGRMGRGTGSRDQGRGFSRQPDNLEPVDSWDNSQANTTDVKADDTWGDWDNEEYTGSLADSKVFTPSTATQPSTGGELAAPPGLEQQILNPPSAHADDLVGVQQFTGSAVVSSTTTAAVVAGTAAINNNSVQYPELGTAAQIRQALDMPQINSSTLSAEQSQYFNSLSSQNSSQTANVNSYQPASVQYPAAYGANSSFGDTVSSQPTVRKTTRARVPPPSKIPSSAVEMPGDTLNNIGYLDVQFGGLDFGTEDSFDTLTDKFNATSLDSTSTVSNPGDVASDYQSKNSQQSLTAGLQTSQMRTANSVSQQSSGSVNNSVNVINNSAGSGASGYQQYTNNTSAKGPTSYQAAGTGQGGYSNTNYASTQVSSTNSYPPTSSYSSYNQNSVNSYQSQNSANNVAAVNNSSNASNSSSTTSIPVGGGSAGVGNSASVTSSSVSSSAPSAVNNSAVTTSSMSSPSLGLTKVTSATSKTSGMVPNIPPMVSQYIQTAGVPFYQPQAMYSLEDFQIMQQRMPHMQPEYYNLNYPTPTSLGAGVRDANLGSVAAYSTMSDGRFTRTDNNSSPVSNVPSTMSQQTGSGGQLMNVPYYFYGANMVPGSFQYGMYPVRKQQMATASATSGGQFPKPSYNSAYGSTAYDTLSQTTQDYSKSAYPGSGVGQQSKGQNVNNPPPAGTGSDITSSMYSKTHVALNKVNSYEKQSFHSGTPPPFNLAGTQTAGATSAQPYGMYIPAIPPPHHNMNMHQPIHQDFIF
ncbi:protein lingerer isoform X17 [Phlebotomus papatasi]|uniref:protein lingerer isoform X17 n=1 Tax=Phlebotomus papatasi TaxID=29031 RepID=UPI002483B98E|nr:protein lingerer isoform X17 [Phlebotomus papatasi]